MVTADDIKRLMLQGEGLNLEMKKCKKDSLPASLWETYSAFANTRGGLILLGLEEDKSRCQPDRFSIVGVTDSDKLVTDLFNMLHNPQKVNRCVLMDSDVQVVDVDGVDVIYINVPEAYYRQKPIYINNDLKGGTYKRLHEGDRHVTSEELAMLIRDTSDNVDSQIIEGYGFDDIDPETLRKYRQTFRNMNTGHPYEDLSDKDFLIQMGGYSIDNHQRIEGLTMAGLLMFGKSIPIHQNFPNFRFDYLDLIGIEPGDSKKWNDRLTDDGRWVDNIYNFLLIALNKLLFTLPSEGRLKGVQRIDGGELYEGVREAFINSLTYCDYLLGGVLRIDRRTDRIVMRNPGNLRIPPERIYRGDYTLARNSTVQKMLRMVGFGDNIGSGFSKILKAWKSLQYPTPVILEQPDVNEVWLTLPLPQPNVGDNVRDLSEIKTDNVTDKTDNVTDKTENVTDKTKNVTDKTENVTKATKRRGNILEILKSNSSITTEEIAKILEVSKRTILRDIEFLTNSKIIRRDGGSFGGTWIINNTKE